MPVQRFVSPRSGWPGIAQTRLGNARRLRAAIRAVMARLPFVTLDSDVRDVVYMNWVVPLSRVASLVPPGVRVTTRDGMTILTVLTYAHGHFGPSAAGPLRRVFPSPAQSNWRLYVDRIDGATPARRTVLFLYNLFDSALYAIGTRLLSDALPSHLPATFRHRRHEGHATVEIDGGTGSAPGVRLHAVDTADRLLPEAFAAFYPDWTAAVADLCLQDAAVAPVGDTRLAIAHIALPIAVADVVPMTAVDFIPGAWLDAVGATAMPFCFGVEAVRFRVLGERIVADVGPDRS